LIPAWLNSKTDRRNAVQRARPEAAATTPTPAAEAASSQLFVGRQPILGADQSIYAYELLFRDAADASGARITDNVAATSRLLINTFNNLGIERVLGDKKAFINVSAELIESDVLELLPCERVVLEVLEHVEPTAELIDRCEDLVAKGYALALDDFVYRPEFEQLLDLATYVKIDVRALGMEQAARQLDRLRSRKLKVIAEKVETLAEFNACHDLGMRYFQGYYFARPEVLSMKRVDPQAQRILSLFNLVMSQAKPELIELEFKQDVALSFNLLRYINSVGFGLANKVTAIRHALIVLGHTKLARWLTLLLLSGASHVPAPQALFRTTLTRARLIELLGKRQMPASEHDMLFITGMFSMLDTLLALPLSEALKSLNLPDPVRSALLQDSGPYAPYLAIARACEDLDLAGIERIIEPLRLTLPDVTRAQVEAMSWADSIGTDA
jgi:EAL and modified HD-GYP domain-containing signal transduction protein